MKTQRLMAVLAIALLGVVPGCKKKNENNETPKVTEPTTPTPPPKPEVKPLEGKDLAAAYQKCWDDFNQRKWDDFGNCYADDATSEQAGGMRPELKGRDAIVGYVKAFATAMPDSKGTLQLTLVSGRTVVGIALQQGTQTAPMKGPMGEIPATNKKIGMLVGHVVTFNDKNQVTKETWYQDTTTMMGQLGLVKQPVRPAMDKGWDQPVTLVSEDNDAEKANIALYNQSTEAFNKHDLKAMSAGIADDGVWSEMAAPKDMNKKESEKDTKAMFKAFPDAKITTDQTFAAGDYVVATGTMTGTNKGDMPAMHLKKTGKTVNLPFMEVDMIKDGKCGHSWLFYDGAAMAQQLGLMPPPGGDKAAPKKG